MMLRLSSGSLTARRALRTVSGVGVGIAGLGSKGSPWKLMGRKPLRGGGDFSLLTAHCSSAFRDQLLVARVRHQPDGRIRKLGSHQLETVLRARDLGVEASVGEKHQKEIASRVDPELGSGKAGVSVRRVADQRP